MPLVRLSEVSKLYRLENSIIKALDKVSLDIDKGSFVSVIGKSGAGKTTLLRIINNLEAPDLGNVEFESVNRTGTVFQEPRLIRTKTVEKNILLALRHEKDYEVKKKLAKEAVEMVGLTDFINAYPFQLSGGMAQRVSLGRALCRKPELLLLDEPFGSLDAITRGRLQKELSMIYRCSSITVVFVTHDLTEAILLGSRILVMNDGKITDDIKINLNSDKRNEDDIDFIKIKHRMFNSINHMEK